MQHPPCAAKAGDPKPAAPGVGSVSGRDDDGHQLEVTLESMAPMHATGNAALLSDVRPAPPDQEPFGGGLHVAALGRLATPRFDVPDVRHVPGLGGQHAVVVSVGELAARGFVVGFGIRTCAVSDMNTGERVGTGRLCGGRYYLD